MIIGMGLTPLVQGIPSDNANENAKDVTTVVVPDHAKEIAPGIFSLGTTIHEGQVVEGFVVFHHREGHGGGPPDRGGVEDDTNSCFDFIGDRNQKWKTIEPWVINTENNGGLVRADILGHFNNDIAQWENAAGKEILGVGSETTKDLEADFVEPDKINEVYFAKIVEPDGSTGNVIAMNIVWMNIRGPPVIFEWDQVYDDDAFAWSFDGESDKMDFDNVATHEIGHATGMAHPIIQYDSDGFPDKDDPCRFETMYAFTEDGDTDGRDLNDGDIAGIQKLY